MREAPTALYYHEPAGLTFRWHRGDTCMTVHEGDAISGRLSATVAQVPVPATWVDQTEVQQRAKAWLAERNGRGR